MEPIDPFSYLFDAAGQLTGGLVTDLQSAFLGLLVLGFILLGLDVIKEALLNSSAVVDSFGQWRSSRHLARLRRESGDDESFRYNDNGIGLDSGIYLDEDRWNALDDALEETKARSVRGKKMSSYEVEAMFDRLRS
ncbi:hypothetical protein [Desulfogranum marinum]|uniref:hypothetical protein n=1 Tax=Desulfogranum marinum TaxID=453220 RepID=UPI0029C74FBC|nr:hypothetical protein [Desulfogranum marinum]